MMAQNTPEDKEISDLDSHETKKSSKCAELISVGASNDSLTSYVHCRLQEENLQEAPPINSALKRFAEFMNRRGEVYEEALKIARPISDQRSEAEMNEDKRIEELFLKEFVELDFEKYQNAVSDCGRVECWAARHGLVNIVVALIRQRGAKSLNQRVQPTSMSMGLLALAIAAENHDLTMVDALKDIAGADESFKSSEPDFLFSETKKHYRFYSKFEAPVYLLYPFHEVWLCPIEAAARRGLVDMVRKLIELRKAKMEAKKELLRQEMMMKVFGVAKMEADRANNRNELFEVVMEKEFRVMMTREKRNYRRAYNWAVKMGHREVLLRIEKEYTVDLNEPSDVRGLLDNADVKSYGWRQTPLALAVLSANFEMVEFLCLGEDLRTDAKNGEGKSAIQMAFNKSRYGARAQRHVRYKISDHIMKRSDSQREVKKLTEERKVHVDAINAILVGTALIATATFAGWLSPPLGYSSPPGTDGPFASVEGHPILEKFWVFNSLSFFFSIATFMVGANVALPPPEEIYIGDVVQSLRWKLTLAYFLVSAAVLFVIAAFASAGFAVLPPIPKYTVNMALTVGIGVIIVAVVVFSTFFGHMFTKSGWHQLKDKMKFHCWQQSKDEMESSDDD